MRFPKSITLLCVLAIFCTTTVIAPDNEGNHATETSNSSFVPRNDAKHNAAYKHTLKLIKEHNELAAQGKSSFTLKANHFADFTEEELRQAFESQTMNMDEFKKLAMNTGVSTGVNTMPTGNPNGQLRKRKNAGSRQKRSIPTGLNWLHKGRVSGIVRDQASCNSCYAIAAIEAMEAEYAQITGKFVRFSPQQILDCDKAAGQDGCNMGRAVIVMLYLMQNGLATEEAYPWVGKRDNEEKNKNYCYLDQVNPSKVVNFGFAPFPLVEIKQGSEEDLFKAVAEHGPVIVAICVPSGLSFFDKGVVYDANCQGYGHSMLLVGFGSSTYEGDYWWLRNMYGPGFGENGYMRIARGWSKYKQPLPAYPKLKPPFVDNVLGIADQAFYPNVLGIHNEIKA